MRKEWTEAQFVYQPEQYQAFAGNFARDLGGRQSRPASRSWSTTCGQSISSAQPVRRPPTMPGKKPGHGPGRGRSSAHPGAVSEAFVR
jgi:hypothetical protein